MTKTGKPEGCWAGIMHQYAQGKHRFSTGQRPESKKWKSVIQRIDACPLTPKFNLPVRYIDIFGRRILCKCGYHVLDPAHRNRFPAVLTAQLALDRKCVTVLKPRTVGNSSSYLQQALEEVHSEE
ncbi:hypothetical protein KUCAC02_010236 [Chaenocephalus aceratus]|uniref:Uncharacterized protein n=1 Tax=Chaenocephalus aceratus TaxID=36190 RepID=A0ACB9VYF7_CHAAC|nr:hypothetical protein KUCAC02_010236 [Chaenocephalus aceratus]